MKKYADAKARARPCKIRIGDPVLIRNTDRRKTSLFQATPLVVTGKKGSMITVQKGDRQTITRNSSFFKRSPLSPQGICDNRGVTPELEMEPIVTPPNENPTGDARQEIAIPDLPTPPTPRRSGREIRQPLRLKKNYVLNYVIVK